MSPANQRSRALLAPISRFLHLEAASGVLLLAATAVALIWANSPWAGSYEALWETPIRVGIAGWTVAPTGHFLVNDGLMAIFFFAVGLEIRRELHSGELSDARRAALPVFAALGGMLVPAAIYLAVNRGVMSRGWGVPMATDIAFAVGALALLGKRAAPSMRVFLLALAIIDDIGAILVIAIFYPTAFHIEGLVLAVAGVGAIISLQRLRVRRPLAYGIPAIAIWLGAYRAGVHPAIAGVVTGMLMPTVAGELERMERLVHPWAALAIMPLFALANAGIDVSGVQLTAAPTLAFGIAAGLLVGKPVGVIAAAAVAVRLGAGRLSGGLTWRGVAVIGALAGIGFTMSLFIAGLAFADQPALHDAAKLVILLASATAACSALLLGRALIDPA